MDEQTFLNRNPNKNSKVLVKLRLYVQFFVKHHLVKKREKEKKIRSESGSINRHLWKASSCVCVFATDKKKRLARFIQQSPFIYKEKREKKKKKFLLSFYWIILDLRDKNTTSVTIHCTFYSYYTTTHPNQYAK